MTTQGRLGCIALLILFLFAPSCTQQAVSDEAALELRSYSVPDGFDVQQLREYLQSSLSRGETRMGTVVAYPDGRLVVTAPPGVHRGVEQLMRDLKKTGPRASEPVASMVAVRYWAVIARPAAVGTRQTINFAPDSPYASEPLRVVLEELVATQGPLEFSIVEQVRLTSLDQGDRSETRGQRLQIKQRVLQTDAGAPVADISIASFGSKGITHSLETRVRLETGKYIVLGQTAYNPRGGGLPAGWSPSDGILLYYVIAAEDA
ncbi:MAG: hypothetical protein JSV80_02585 [Acidobacteriota bacterium]|nr:MAG: hypothetical protein JSV80_02585 [Acidobacteriota bacterium]